MTTAELTSLLPLMLLSAVAVLVMLEIAVRRNHFVTALTTCVGLAATMGSFVVIQGVLPVQVTPLLIMDGYAVFFMLVVLVTSLAVALLSYTYLEGRSGHHEEYYLLLLTAALGGMVLTASSHFASFFVGLATLSVSLYGLVAYTRGQWRSVEAGIKYLILSGASDAFLVMGMALIYSQTGTLQFARIAQAAVHGNPTVMLAASCILIAGVGFKLSLVPFHLWTPDVYEGSSAPVAAFLATVSKTAVFAVLFRYYLLLDADAQTGLHTVFSVLAVASMVVGNLLALLQNNVKRILAYSSIAHLGYLLVAFLASSSRAVPAAGFYLVAYCVTTLGAFGVITVLSRGERDYDRLQDYGGLGWTKPWMGAVFSAMLLSFAGIPLTAGFIGKFYVLTAGVGSSLWLLVVTLVMTSVIGLFYYLRIILKIYSGGMTESSRLFGNASIVDSLVLVALAILLVWLGVWPLSLIRFIEITVLASL
jgi:NADH-quinone oxidoreductase subunit N